jgi:hypothetical protein
MKDLEPMKKLWTDSALAREALSVHRLVLESSSFTPI